MPTSATDKESITDAAAELQVAAAAYKSAHLGCNQTPCHGHSCYGNILGNIDAWKEFVRTHGGN